MGSSKAGFKQIVACTQDTLTGGSPAGAVALGLNKGLNLKITPHKQVEVNRNRKLRNQKNFAFEGNSLQVTPKMIKSFLVFGASGCDVQLVTNPQSGSANSEDVFKFAGIHKIGNKFEYMISSEERSLKAMFEGAMEYEKAKAFIDLADSETAVVFSGITGDGADFTNYHAPYYMAIESPASTELFSIDEIVSRELKLSLKSKTDIYNRAINDEVLISLSITARDATIAKIVSEMNKVSGAKVLWKEQNSAVTYDGFDFNTNVLVQSDEVEISSEDRTIKASFEGAVPIWDPTYDFDVSGGGDASAEGDIGGTIKFGYS